MYNEQEMLEKKQWWIISKYHSYICLDNLRKTMKNVSLQSAPRNRVELSITQKLYASPVLTVIKFIHAERMQYYVQRRYKGNPHVTNDNIKVHKAGASRFNSQLG
jgi:hypothetical protein